MALELGQCSWATTRLATYSLPIVAELFPSLESLTLRETSQFEAVLHSLLRGQRPVDVKDAQACFCRFFPYLTRHWHKEACLCCFRLRMLGCFSCFSAPCTKSCQVAQLNGSGAVCWGTGFCKRRRMAWDTCLGWIGRPCTETPKGLTTQTNQ